jgi:hypothetical protein
MSFTCNYGVISPEIDEDFSDELLEKNLPKNDADSDEPVFIGNSRTKVFHQKDCYCVKQIRSDHQEALDLDLKDSKGKVYRACCKCFPRPEVVEKLEEQTNLGDY